MILRSMSTVWVVVLSVAAATHAHVLHTAQGVLRGSAAGSGAHVSYRGVPYAGNPAARRFRKAPPAPAWEGVRDATAERAGCGEASTEDCLLLDVHVPTDAAADRPAPPPLRPVLVWLVSAAGVGSPRRLSPDAFTRRGIVLVAVDYRRGPLGFLRLGREEAPGNAGAKDVLEALRWVRDNIVAFGGDAARVTLAGQGVGAAVAESLVLSPASERLIHGAILQSGSALNPWAYHYDSEARARATALARRFTNSTDGDDTAAALLHARAEDLVSEARSIDFAYFPFALSAEKQFRKEEMLLGASPIDILTAGKFKRVPMLIGSNSNEAYVLAPILIRANAVKRALRDFFYAVPAELQFVSESEARDVAERIRKSYFEKRNLTIEGLLEYYTEALFSSHVLRSAAMHAAASELPVYCYRFAEAGDGGRGAPPVRGASKTGAAHADELEYLFANVDGDPDGDQRKLQELMTSLWANFVVYGNPTPPASVSPQPPAWEATRGAELRLFVLDAGEAGMRDAPHAEAARRRLWEDIYARYYYSRRLPS